MKDKSIRDKYRNFQNWLKNTPEGIFVSVVDLAKSDKMFPEDRRKEILGLCQEYIDDVVPSEEKAWFQSVLNGEFIE